MKTVEIEIFGKKYYLKSNEPEKVMQKATILNTKLEELNEKFNTVDYTKLFVLYMLILLDELEFSEQKNLELNQKLQQVEELLNNLNEE